MSDRIVGVLTSGGEVIGPDDPHRKMPPKQVGRHRWIGVSSFVLSDEQAEAAVTPGNRVLMDGSNIVGMGIGCVDCEQPYELAKATVCPRGDEWTAAVRG